VPADARPRYADLPDGCAWDVLDPELGSLGLLTPERVAAAALLVRTGRRFPLDLMLDQPSPPMFGRQPFRHDVYDYAANILDDKLDNFYPQGSTQWDAFGHFGHPTKGYFGGHDSAAVKAGAIGIDKWAAVGIAGRGVLLDVARQADIPGDSGFAVTPELLDQTADAQGVTVDEGTVLCVRVGWLAWYRTLDDEARAALASGDAIGSMKMPGLGPGPAVAEWLWDHGVAAIAVDNPAVEAMPMVGGVGAEDILHTRVLALLGIPLGEFFDLDALAEDCAADGVYEFFFTSKPLGIPGGVGSPPNAMAIK
jgi:kynurenine formamidase